MGETARRIIGLAETAGRPLSIVATADGPGQELAPTDAAEVRRRLEAMAPRPYAPDYAAVLPSLDAASRANLFGGVVWLSDGLSHPGSDSLGTFLTQRIDGPLIAYADASSEAVALKPPLGAADALVVPTKLVQTQGQQKIVTVIYKGEQFSVPVQIGLVGDSTSEVVSGLQEGDVVVSAATTTRTTTTPNNTAIKPGGFRVPGGGG